MHLSFILSSLWLSGGNMVVIEYANRLAARGHVVSLIVPAGTIDKKLMQAEVASEVRLIESGVSLPTTRNPLHLFRLTFSLLKATPSSEVIIATHTPTTVPTLLASIIGRKGSRVWLYQDYEEMFRNRPIEKLLLKHAPKLFDRVAVVSEACRQDIWENAQVEAIVISEGLTQPELLFGKPRQLDPKIKRVLYVGDARPRKGLSDLLAAAEIVYKQLPELRLSIVSKEPCEVNTAIPFDFFEFPSRQELGDLYRSCNLFVSASWAEGFGLPPLEAMACGAPVVLTNSRGVLDYAKPNQNCLMVPPRDPRALAQAMVQILVDEVLANRLSTNGPKTAKKFNWDTAVDRFEALLITLIDS